MPDIRDLKRRLRTWRDSELAIRLADLVLCGCSTPERDAEAEAIRQVQAERRARTLHRWAA